LKSRNSLIIVILLATVIVTTPLVAIVHAEKTVVPFSSYSKTAVSSAIAVDANQKNSQDEDEHLAIRWGTVRKIPYSNPAVGSGWLNMTTLRSITNWEIPPAVIGSSDFTGARGSGHGVYKLFLNITSGPYGAGTFEGFGVLKWEYDFTQTPLIHLTIGNYTLMQGTGAFEGAKLNWNLYSSRLPSNTQAESWRVGELILP